MKVVKKENDVNWQDNFTEFWKDPAERESRLNHAARIEETIKDAHRAEAERRLEEYKNKFDYI